mmetsp:Transcript_9778/g.39780  ORF Transcript_9778/g.39780 Transcript_9778/m.39780 type:complete len:290 (-) Transcript_9778:832-1701(-)
MPAHSDVSVATRRAKRATLAASTRFRDITKAVGTLLVPPPPPAPSSAVEGAELFRVLGVPPTAEYDEVQRAVELLKAKYQDDKKKQLQIDVTKDKIAELRLRQRMRGTLAVSSEVAYLDRQARLEAKRQFQRVLLEARPKWMRRIPRMWLPPWRVNSLPNAMDRKWGQVHIRMAGSYYLGCSLLAILVPGSLGALKYAAPFIFLNHLAQRGRQPVARGPGGFAGEIRETVYSDYLWSAAILAAHFIVGALLAEIVVQLLPLLRPMQTRFLVTTASLALADVLWQPTSRR